jgi:GT2 family glycosyltransferase/glycosyltransferase involved in cell wall biosynthesis
MTPHTLAERLPHGNPQKGGQRALATIHAPPMNPTNRVDMSELADDTVAVVVHYRNYELIGETIRSLVTQGIPAERILIVDTSDEPDGADRLRNLIPAGATALHIENKGYGNAVNTGIRHWAGAALAPRYVLVATHEVSWMPYAVAWLRSALAAAPHAAAAGPTLVTGEAPYSVWSEGGVLSGKLGLPRHIGHQAPYRPNLLDGRQPQERAWLDGSCVLYDFAAIAENPIDETYFLYMEETDLHLRLAKLGRQILWVPNAVAWQSSLGIPAEYSTRNLRLLYTRSGRKALGRIAVPVDAARQLASSARRGRLRQSLRPLLRGLTTALPPATPATPAATNANVIIINPLGAALRHYTQALVSVLAEDGTRPHTREFQEPSASGNGRISWVLTYCRQLTAARRLTPASTTSVLIIAWPVLGHLDSVLISLFYRRPAWLVVHDPTPLVRAIGYDRLSRRIGRVFSRNTHFIVHSTAAQSALSKQGLTNHTVLLPHPILPPVNAPRPRASDGKPRIRVLGQYKPDRDLAILTTLATELAESHVLEIFGRGWPAVPGWTLSEGFMTENEMVRRITDADVILIPYSRFYQSGIAIRAIEAGTPVVGLKASSLADLLGSDSRLLVEAGGARPEVSWANAIAFAVTGGRAAIWQLRATLRDSTVASWQEWTLGGLSPDSRERGPRPRTVVVLGDGDGADQAWLDSGFVTKVVRFRRPAPSGSRFGSRILGIGLDSLIVTAMSLKTSGPVLALNPWIAVALKLSGKRDVAVIGMYAERGSASFRLLRRVLSTSPVLTTASVEANEWTAAGGRAIPVLYGGDSNYPLREQGRSSRLRIFVGGSSDRDAALLEQLTTEIRSSSSPCSLMVVSPDAPRSYSTATSTITYTGYVSRARFGELLSASDVLFLPIRQGRRAAGHMVMSAALEAGVPVITNLSSGMQGYVDGTFVAWLDASLPLLPQLERHAAALAAEGPAIRAFWQQQFCRAAFIERIRDALHTMELDDSVGWAQKQLTP